MQTILLVIYLMVVVALIGVVLIQRSEGGGLGIGGGSGFMSARGTANALTRTTAILATLFFVLALGMGILARYESRPTDILDQIPGTTGTGGVLDALGGGENSTETPATGNDGVPTDNGGVPTDNGGVPTDDGASNTGNQQPTTGQQTTTGQQSTTGEQNTTTGTGTATTGTGQNNSDVPSGQ